MMSKMCLLCRLSHYDLPNNGAIVEQVFRSGYQTVVQMIVAGLAPTPIQKGEKAIE